MICEPALCYVAVRFDRTSATGSRKHATVLGVTYICVSGKLVWMSPSRFSHQAESK